MEPSLSEVQTLSLPAPAAVSRGHLFDLPPQSALTTSPFSRRETRPGMPMSIFSMPSPCDLTEWGDEKGRMTEQYVEETVRAHFDRYNIAHGPLFKTWDYDAETGIYTAIPQGIKSLPMCSLRDFRFSIRDGSPLFDVTLDFCSFDGVEPRPR